MFSIAALCCIQKISQIIAKVYRESPSMAFDTRLVQGGALLSALVDLFKRLGMFWSYDFSPCVLEEIPGMACRRSFSSVVL